MTAPITARLTARLDARRLTRAALLLVATTMAAWVQAQEPAAAPQPSERAQLREARGSYALEDGRSVKVVVGQTRLNVSIDEQATEDWHAETPDLLVSPDGLRRLRLVRDADGSVNRIALETDRQR